MRRFAIIFVLGVFVCSLFSQHVFAQSSSSAVEGTIQDASGAAIPDCDVTLRNTETGAALSTRTDGAGLYVFPSILPGMYSLKFSREGFKSHSVTDFRVTISQRVTESVVLEVGTVSESVIVEAFGSVPLLEPTSNEIGTLIDQVNVSQLPLNGRDFLQLGMPLRCCSGLRHYRF